MSVSSLQRAALGFLIPYDPVDYSDFFAAESGGPPTRSLFWSGRNGLGMALFFLHKSGDGFYLKTVDAGNKDW
jgi:hypothetical protein